MLLLAEECRNYLVDEDLVRLPSSRGNAIPCYVESPTGAPTPAEAEAETVVHLRGAGGLPSQPYQGEWIDQLDIDFHIRSTDTRAAYETGLLLSKALDDKRAFEMGDLRVEAITRTRPFDRLFGADPGQGITLVGQFRFLVRKNEQVPAS